MPALVYVVRAGVAGCWVGLVLRVSRVIQVETPHFACQLAGSLHPYSLGMSYRDWREQGTLARRVLSLVAWSVSLCGYGTRTCLAYHLRAACQ